MTGASAGLRALPKYVMMVVFGACMGFVFSDALGENSLGRDLEQLTGAHTRLVWIHHGQPNELTVLDSQDGVSRILHKGFSG